MTVSAVTAGFPSGKGVIEVEVFVKVFLAARGCLAALKDGLLMLSCVPRGASAHGSS